VHRGCWRRADGNLRIWGVSRLRRPILDDIDDGHIILMSAYLDYSTYSICAGLPGRGCRPGQHAPDLTGKSDSGWILPPTTLKPPDAQHGRGHAASETAQHHALGAKLASAITKVESLCVR
jgi:hypothetical protein